MKLAIKKTRTYKMEQFDSFTKCVRALKVGDQLEVDYGLTTVNSMGTLLTKERQASGHNYTLVSGEHSALITRLK